MRGLRVACVLSIFAGVVGSVIPLNGASAAHVFDGVGGLSAGASSSAAHRLTQSRNDLKFSTLLFLPNYALSMQIFKVEIGGK